MHQREGNGSSSAFPFKTPTSDPSSGFTGLRAHSWGRFPRMHLDRADIMPADFMSSGEVLHEELQVRRHDLDGVSSNILESVSSNMKGAHMCREMHPMSAHEGCKDKVTGQQRQMKIPQKNCDQTEEGTHCQDAEKWRNTGSRKQEASNKVSPQRRNMA